MAKQKGREMILEIWDGSSAYVAIAGLKTKGMTFGVNLVDVTTADAATPPRRRPRSTSVAVHWRLSGRTANLTLWSLPGNWWTRRGSRSSRFGSRCSGRSGTWRMPSGKSRSTRRRT